MSEIPAGAYVLDATASSVVAAAKHVGGAAPAVVTFPLLAGTGAVGDGSSAEVHVSAVGLKSGSGLRDRVLRSGLWLGVSKHPELVVVLRSFDGTAGTADLTVRGRTRPMDLRVTEVTAEGARVRLVVTATVDWRAYGVGSPGLVQPTVEVTATLVANRTE